MVVIFPQFRHSLACAYNGFSKKKWRDIPVLELLTAGGWLMVLIVLCSIVVLAICIERLYTLNPKKIAPPHLLATVWKQLKAGEMDAGSERTTGDSRTLIRAAART